MDRKLKELQAKHNQFSWSQPVGYDFEEVEEEIGKLAAMLQSLTSKLAEKESQLSQAESEINKLKRNLTDVNQSMMMQDSAPISFDEAEATINNFTENKVINGLDMDNVIIDPLQEPLQSASDLISEIPTTANKQSKIKIVE